MKRLLLLAVLLLAIVGTASADTLIVYTTNATDVELSYGLINGTFSVLHDQSTGTVTNGVNYHRVGIYSLSTWENRFYRLADIFDTSALPDTCTIESALLGETVAASVYTLGDDGVAPVTYTYDGAFNTDDYGYTKYGTTILAPYKNLSTMTTTGVYYNWSLNSAGLAAISKTGNTPVALRIRADIENTSAWVDFQNGTSKGSRATFWTADYVLYPPFLEIAYTPADTTPPQSITGLANGTFDCTDHHVDLSWTNPGDADYYRLNAYLNGTLTYYGNTTDSVTLEGLPESTTISFNTTTEDLAGNLNATWVNISFVTDSCAAPPETGEVCYFVNTTAESIRANSTSWNITIGNISWGTLIVNATQGNLSHWSCFGTPTPTSTPTPIPTTIKPTWTPEINPPSPESLVGTIKDWIKNFLKDVFK
jgi:hypothetical protein